jgi:bifunctional DNA-binding transcriptional regulator/antitoxin component of YhaV-PrlF toxin-antitoxin module
MDTAYTIQLSQRGIITLPKSLRQRYGLQTGDILSLLDLDGVFVLSPRRSEIAQLADELKDALELSGENLESMLLALRERREGYSADDDR